MKTVLAIRHVSFEDLGSFSSVLREAGFRIAYLEIGRERLDWTRAHSPDLCVLLGGPIGAYDEQYYPFLVDELKYLEKRLEAQLPTLGICLGAQLIARTLGARVYPGRVKEIGWSPLSITDEGLRNPAHHLAGSKTQMFHWHGDTFDLPKGASLLASTDLYTNQIFSMGSSTLAVQCHPEVDFEYLEDWFIGHAGEVQATGLSLPDLRRETSKFGPKLKTQGRLFFEQRLKSLSLL